MGFVQLFTNRNIEDIDMIFGSCQASFSEKHGKERSKSIEGVVQGV